jgi:hypothetical protein
VANAIDVLTLAEGKQALRVNDSDTTNGALLAAAITGVSQALDVVAGPIVTRTFTNERHDGGDWTVTVRHFPVYSIGSVTEYDGTSSQALIAETVGTVPTAGYISEPYAGLSGGDLLGPTITRRSGGWDYPFPAGRGNVVVTYTAGRFTNTAAVTEQFKHAARITLENWWQQFNQGIGSVGEFEVPVSSFPRFAVPNAARQALGLNETHDDAVRLG